MSMPSSTRQNNNYVSPLTDQEVDQVILANACRLRVDKNNIDLLRNTIRDYFKPLIEAINRIDISEDRPYIAVAMNGWEVTRKYGYDPGESVAAVTTHGEKGIFERQLVRIPDKSSNQSDTLADLFGYDQIKGLVTCFERPVAISQKAVCVLVQSYFRNLIDVGDLFLGFPVTQLDGGTPGTHAIFPDHYNQGRSIADQLFERISAYNQRLLSEYSIALMNGDPIVGSSILWDLDDMCLPFALTHVDKKNTTRTLEVEVHKQVINFLQGRMHNYWYRVYKREIPAGEAFVNEEEFMSIARKIVNDL